MKEYYYHTDGGVQILSEEELLRESPHVQRAVMEDWFRYNFQAPDNGAIGGKDGFLFLNGGPYNPNDVLREEFKGISEDVIFGLIDDLWTERSEWAPTPNGNFFDPRK